MDVKALEYLTSLEDEGSITKVAQKFYISPSALSQCLTKQEAEIGVPLFVREDGRFIPTPQGRIYLKCAREIIEIKESTYRQIKNLEDNRQSLRITAAFQLYPVLMEVILPKLQELFPSSRFDIQAEDSYTAKQYLINGLADLAVLCLPDTGNSLLAQTVLADEQLAAVVSTTLLKDPTVIAARQTAISEHLRPESPPALGDFSQLPFILLKNGSSFRAAENDILAAHQMMVHVIYEADTFFIAKDFVQAGNGVAFLPYSMAKDCDNCSIIPLNTSFIYHHILAYPKYKELTAEGKKAAELIKHYYKLK